MADVIDIRSIIFGILEKEFGTIMGNDPALYKDFNIVLSNEQQYVKDRENKHNNIFISVKLSEGVKDRGQLQQNIMINAIGEQNSIEVCQRLLHELAQTYSVDADPVIQDELIIKQAYSTPMMMQNFSTVWSGYRSLFYMSGTFFVGFNTNLIDSITWIKDDEHDFPIDFISASTHYSAQPDSRAEYGSKDFNNSVALIRTLSLSMSIYNTIDDFNTAVYNVIYGISPVDTVFKFAISYKNTGIFDENNKRPIEVEMRLIDASDPQQLRAFPVRALTFLR